MMRRTTAFLFLSFFAVSGIACAESPAPDFTLNDLSGEPVTLSSFRGQDARPVLLAFGTTWCPYCREQIPTLISLREEFEEADLGILAVDIKEDPDKVAGFYQARDIHYPVLLDTDSAVANLYQVGGIPHFVLIDRAGNIAYVGHRVTDEVIDQIRSF